MGEIRPKESGSNDGITANAEYRLASTDRGATAGHLGRRNAWRRRGHLVSSPLPVKRSARGRLAAKQVLE